jgi:hypothetical protein
LDLLHWVEKHDQSLVRGIVMESGPESLIYFPDLRWSSWIQGMIETDSMFRIYYFENESSSQKKVRVEWAGS